MLLIRPLKRFNRPLIIFGCFSWLACFCPGQIDPVPRQLIQLGYNQPLEGKGPIAGYAYYYRNQPNFIRTNFTLRLAVAPTYLDSELGIHNALGSRTDIGIGMAGGGFADSYSEVREGFYHREESFTGHNAEGNVSLYHRFNPDSQIPLYGIARVGVHQSFYERDDSTAPGFSIPQDQTILHIRSGVRYGGKEPLIMPKLAGELSAWYDTQFRSNPGQYGYGGDRVVEPNTHQFWARALLAYTMPEWQHQFSVSMTLGTSINSDRLSAYRLGGVLPMVSEFPLNLPGYYFQELSAQRYIVWEGQYILPLTPNKRFSFIGNVGTAVIDYQTGLEQPGYWHSGLGGGFGYQSPSGAWQWMLGYGYGFDAIRDGERGAQVIGILCQYDLEARPDDNQAHKPWIKLNKLRGFDWIFGH